MIDYYDLLVVRPLDDSRDDFVAVCKAGTVCEGDIVIVGGDYSRVLKRERLLTEAAGTILVTYDAALPVSKVYRQMPDAAPGVEEVMTDA